MSGFVINPLKNCDLSARLFCVVSKLYTTVIIFFRKFEQYHFSYYEFNSFRLFQPLYFRHQETNCCLEPRSFLTEEDRRLKSIYKLCPSSESPHQRPLYISFFFLLCHILCSTFRHSGEVKSA